LTRDFSSGFIFSASRSSGPGGQNVNKVSSKIELRFQIDGSQLLSDEEKEIIKEKLKNKISNDGYLILSCQTEKSQLQNKEKCIEKFYRLLEKALSKPKTRKPTKPGKQAIRKRLESKKQQSEKKATRSKNIRF
jgi:ribosome-associated protein